MSHHQNPNCWTCGHDCYSDRSRQVIPAQASSTYCHRCMTYKEMIGPNRYRCKCDPEEQDNPFALQLFQANNSIQRSMVVPPNGVLTRHYHNIERGVHTYQRIIMKNGQAVETEEFSSHSYK